MTAARSASRPTRLRVVVTGGSSRAASSANGLARWIQRYAPTRATGTVAIAVVSDARMRRLNREFRGVDRPTDVLSFPANDPTSKPQASTAKPQTWSRNLDGKSSIHSHLGDIAIALGVAGRQARAEGHPLSTEMKILALHGLLHLLGYDHERDSGTMQRVEDRLRRRAGLPSGLIARAPRRASRR